MLADLRETQTKLAKVVERTETLTNLIIDSEVIAPRMLKEAHSEQRRRPVFALVRQGSEGPQDIVASENDLIEPGDVLKVDGERQDVTGASRGSTSLVPTRAEAALAP